MDSFAHSRQSRQAEIPAQSAGARAMLGRPYVALVALATVLRAERVADDGWLPQCTVDFEYASCFPCRSTDAAAVLKERCLFVSALMNATNCVFEDGFFNSTAGANVT